MLGFRFSDAKETKHKDPRFAQIVPIIVQALPPCTVNPWCIDPNRLWGTGVCWKSTGS
jgi:hypothetical protein